MENTVKTYLYHANAMMEELEDIKYFHLTKEERNANILPARNSATDPKIGRNEQCSCGSGMKYKKCCLKNKNH